MPSGAALLLAAAVLVVTQVIHLPVASRPGLAGWLAAFSLASWVTWSLPALHPPVDLNGAALLAPLAGCLVLRRSTRAERRRAAAGALVAAAILFGVLPWSERGLAGLIGVSGLLAGLAATALGRTPLAAVGALALALPLTGLAQWIAGMAASLPGSVPMGGGPAFDAACLGWIVAAATVGKWPQRLTRPSQGEESKQALT